MQAVSHMDEKVEKIIAYARHRYLTDPEFHARAAMAVQIAEEVHRQERGLGWNENERQVAIEAAAIGLAMEWVDPTTGEIIDR